MKFSQWAMVAVIAVFAAGVLYLGFEMSKSFREMAEAEKAQHMPQAANVDSMVNPSPWVMDARSEFESDKMSERLTTDTLVDAEPLKSAEKENSVPLAEVREIQLKRLLELKFNEAAGMNAEEFSKLVPMPEEGSALLVVNESLLSIADQCRLLGIVNQLDSEAEVMTLILSKKKFKTADSAKQWISDRGFRTVNVEGAADCWKFRQIHPDLCEPDSFRNSDLEDGVIAVLARQKALGRSQHVNLLSVSGERKLYWRYGLDYGEATLGISVSAARRLFKWRRVRPATTVEVLAIFSQHRDNLRWFLDAAGSDYIGSRSPHLWRNRDAQWELAIALSDHGHSEWASPFFRK